jgi:hypothetical protein
MVSCTHRRTARRRAVQRASEVFLCDSTCRYVEQVERPARELFLGNARRRVSRFSSKNSKFLFRCMRFSGSSIVPRHSAPSKHQKVHSDVRDARTRDHEFLSTLGLLDMAPTRAEVALVQLKNCLVNLPSSLVSVLSNANTVRLTGLHFPRAW